MCKIFISGSRQIKVLHKSVIERIDWIIDKQYSIIVGDADGVDSSIQSYLHSKKMEDVIVYCTGSKPRNNIGKWPVKNVETSSQPGTRDYFTAKDLVMAADCNYGFMIWNAMSPGTLSNVIELLSYGKYSRIFVNKEKEFYPIKNIFDFETLTKVMSEKAIEKAETKINLTKKIKDIKYKKLEMKQQDLFEGTK